jgi:hypothetical protein
VSFGNSISALAIDAQNPSTLYVAANWKVLKGTDRGTSWNELPVPLDSLVNPQGEGCDECLAVGLLAVDPQNSSTVYACGSVGVLKSVDGGATWNAMNSGLPWVPAQWDTITALVIDPQNSNNVYVAITGRVFRSTDGAAHWSEVNTGLTVTSVNTLALDPKDPRTVYAGTLGGGIFAITFVP